MLRRTGVFFLLARVTVAISENVEHDAISLLQGRASTFNSQAVDLNASGDPSPNQARCQEFMPPEAYHCDEHNRAPCKEKGDKHNRGCDRNQLRCDKKLYQDTSSHFYMPCCEKTNLFSLLVSIHRALCGQVDYGLFYGSLAGSINEDDLPDHDAEAELAIRGSDVEKAGNLLREQAAKDGFVTTTRNGRFVINWGPKNLLHVDIWFLNEVGFYSEDGCAVVQRSDFFVMKFPSQWLQSLGGKTCHLQGQAFPCPENPKRVLDMYFPSWNSAHPKHGEEPNCGDEACCGLIKRMPGEDKVQA